MHSNLNTLEMKRVYISGVYISQLIRFGRVSSHVADFNARNKSLTAKRLQHGYRYHKLRKTFSKFYRRHYELVSKFNVGLKPLLHQGLSEPEFYGDLVYKFKKNEGRADFSDQLRKIIVRYKRIGYNINIMRQSACLVFKVIVGHIFETSIKCLCFIRSQWNFVCMFFKAFWTQLNKFRGKIYILKTDFILQTCINLWPINRKNEKYTSYYKICGI